MSNLDWEDFYTHRHPRNNLFAAEIRFLDRALAGQLSPTRTLYTQVPQGLVTASYEAHKGALLADQLSNSNFVIVDGESLDTGKKESFSSQIALKIALIVCGHGFRTAFYFQFNFDERPTHFFNEEPQINAPDPVSMRPLTKDNLGTVLACTDRISRAYDSKGNSPLKAALNSLYYAYLLPDSAERFCYFQRILDAILLARQEGRVIGNTKRIADVLIEEPLLARYIADIRNYIAHPGTSLNLGYKKDIYISNVQFGVPNVERDCEMLILVLLRTVLTNERLYDLYYSYESAAQFLEGDPMSIVEAFGGKLSAVNEIRSIQEEVADFVRPPGGR